MASYTKRLNSWRVSVSRQGVRQTATFTTKAEATAWATAIESDIVAGKRGAIPNKKFGDLLDKYAHEVSPTHKGYKWELIRINLLKTYELASVKLAQLSEPDIAKWRDQRLTEVSSESVRREWNLLSSACSVAQKEWKWLDRNPMKDVKRPQAGDSRTRTVTKDELERFWFCCGWDQESKPESMSQQVAIAFALAIETAMRTGELLSLTWKQIDLKKQTAYLPVTKNGHERTVPLSIEALRLLKLLQSKSENVFGISASTLDALFRKYRDKALIEGLHFHDSRRTALSRLSKKVNVFQLAKMSGHRDLKMLLNVYYAEDAGDVAKLLG